MADPADSPSYDEVVAQVESLVADAPDVVAAMASVAALLNDRFEKFFWVGFYRPRADGCLIVGPYQGPLACTLLPAGKGVCGASFGAGETVIVPDVNEVDDHIACDARSRSEIVVPVILDDEVRAVLDVDSTEENAFSEEDRAGLERVCALLASAFDRPEPPSASDGA
jgi:GAF domain-containing protein